MCLIADIVDGPFQADFRRADHLRHRQQRQPVFRRDRLVGQRSRRRPVCADPLRVDGDIRGGRRFERHRVNIDNAPLSARASGKGQQDRFRSFCKGDQRAAHRHGHVMAVRKSGTQLRPHAVGAEPRGNRLAHRRAGQLPPHLDRHRARIGKRQYRYAGFVLGENAELGKLRHHLRRRIGPRRGLGHGPQFLEHAAHALGKQLLFEGKTEIHDVP
jgi:hypothetical protein